MEIHVRNAIAVMGAPGGLVWRILHSLLPGLLVLVLTLAAAPGYSQVADAVTTQEEILTLRRSIDDLQNRLAQLEEKLKSSQAAQQKINDAQTAKQKALSFDGYIQMRYQSDNSDSGLDQFFIRRAPFNIRASINDRVSSRIEVQLAGKDTGKGYGSKALLNETYIDYAGGPGRLRMGQSKIPFGYELLISSRELWSGERSLMFDRLFPDSSDIGLQYRWRRGSEKPSFDFGVFNGAGINANDNNSRKDPAVSVTVPIRAGSAVLSYYNGVDGSGVAKKDRTRLGGGLKIDGKHLAFIGELVSGKDQGADVRGCYCQIGYRLPHSSMAFAKYDTYDENLDQADDSFKRITLGWIRDLTAKARLTAAYEFRSVGDSFSEKSKWNGDVGRLQWQIAY